MCSDPWTADNPQPGDFDVVLASVDSYNVEYHEGNPSATLRVLVGEDEDAAQLRPLTGPDRKSLHEPAGDSPRRPDTHG